MCLALQRRAIFRQFFDISTSKMARTCHVFNILTCKCASRHSGVQFLDIRTSKTWSGAAVFCTFWRANVLRATAACHFSTSKLPKVSQDRQLFSILTCKCALRHSGVPFFLSALSSYLRTRRFSEPTFRPSRPTNHCKTQRFATCLTFRACVDLLSTDFRAIASCFFRFYISSLLFIFWLCFSALHLFQLSIMSEVTLLNFLW